MIGDNHCVGMFAPDEVDNAALRRGAWWVADACSRSMVALYDVPRMRDGTVMRRASSLREEGRLGEAVDILRRRLERGTAPDWLRNGAIDLLISAGAYRAALAVGSMPTRGEAVSVERALVEINLAEADYNLGRWRRARERLRTLDAVSNPYSITRAGLLVQRAWIAARFGQGAAALRLCARVDPRWFPSIYQAEYQFTVAAALLSLKRLDEAEQAVFRGASIALRLSSERNAIFLLARVAAARGDWAAAERCCRSAAEHPFQGQGGDGLLLWGDALLRLGRAGEARRAWALSIERDPEGAAARLAGMRLSRAA